MQKKLKYSATMKKKIKMTHKKGQWRHVRHKFKLLQRNKTTKIK